MEKPNDDYRVVARNYKDLIVWQKSMKLVESVYTPLTGNFPREETYALKSQIHRAVVSVPSNIAEGQARGSQKIEFQRFLYLALGSLAEVDTQLELAIRLMEKS
ncbi:MAG: four helix bundle protein [Chloroflexi bacterium]|nr:four helix bundle protein [Chloroflexota bacterium]